MCKRATCEECGKPTYVGCGLHVEAVLADVPKTDRCRCRATPADVGAPPPPEKPRGRTYG